MGKSNKSVKNKKKKEKGGKKSKDKGMHTKSSVKLTPPVNRPALSSPDPRWNNRPETKHQSPRIGLPPNFKATHYCNKCLKDTAPGLSVPLDRLPSNVTIPTSACVSNGPHCWLPRGEAFQQVCMYTYGSVY